MSKVLIDTSIIIDAIRQKNIEQTIFYKLAENYEELSISILTHAESYAGKSVWESKKAMAALEVLFLKVEVLYPDINISRAAGKIQSEHSIGIVDSLIAATALAHSLPLATLNTKHFEKVKGLKLHKILQN